MFWRQWIEPLRRLLGLFQAVEWPDPELHLQAPE